MNTATKKKPIDREGVIRLAEMMADPANWTQNVRSDKYTWSPLLIAAENDPVDIAKQILKVLKEI